MTTPLLSDSWNVTTIAETVVHATARPLQSYPFYIARQYLLMIYPPFILLFGIFGNIMIIVIMRRTKSGDSAIHIYLTATAVFDMIYLCTITLGQWMKYTFDFDIFTTHNVVCKIFTWLYTGGGTISAWCLVCMTVHRAMSVVWPHRVNVLCTRRTVVLLLTAIAVLLALLYSHFLIGFERVFVANRHWCTVGYDDQNYRNFFANTFVYIELAVYSVLPFAFLVLSNSVLVWKLCVSVKAVNQKFAQGDSEQVQSREKAANSVTLMVIVVSLAFVVLTLPPSINLILNALAINRRRSSLYELVRTAFINSLCELLSQTNNAVNFYLYCLTGKRFREGFIQVLCRGRNGVMPRQ